MSVKRAADAAQGMITPYRPTSFPRSQIYAYRGTTSRIPTKRRSDWREFRRVSSAVSILDYMLKPMNLCQKAKHKRIFSLSTNGNSSKLWRGMKRPQAVPLHNWLKDDKISRRRMSPVMKIWMPNQEREQRYAVPRLRLMLYWSHQFWHIVGGKNIIPSSWVDSN